MKKEYKYERVYLHDSMIITNNFHKNCILIKSPTDSKFGIWFPKCFTGPSQYKNYFWVNIKKTGTYPMYLYKGFKVCQIKEIRAATLIEEYKALKNANPKAFLANTNEDKKDDHPIFNPKEKLEIPDDKSEFIEDDEEKVVWD